MQENSQTAAPTSKTPVLRRRRRSTMTRRTILVMSAFALILMLGICLVADLLYLKVKLEDTTALGYSYAKSASRYVDGDRIAAYVATGQTDEYYELVQQYLNALLKTSSLDYFYIMHPTTDGIVYIWDSSNVPEVKPNPLGTKYPYPKGCSYEIMQEMFTLNPEEKPFFIKDETGGAEISTVYPIYDSKGAMVALSMADVRVDSFNKDLVKFVLSIILSIAILVTLLTIILYIYIKKHIISPIKQLNRGTEDLVSSIDQGTGFNFAIKTGDEIEDLAQSFKNMHQELKDYLQALSKATAEKERIDTELHLATNIQTSMLPKLTPNFASRSEFKIYGTMTPAKKVGGDFYDAFLIDQDHLAMVIADVSDKGVPAALFMVISKTLIKLRTELSDYPSPAQVFKTVNQQLLENNDAGMFVTAWLIIVDLKNGQGHASNAGHEHPVLCHRDGRFELVEYQHSPPLGCLEDLEFEEHDFKLSAGDTIFVYTDGVAEAVNTQGEQFGTDGILKALNKNLGLAPEELVPAVCAELDHYVGEAEQFDDITMLAFTYLGAHDAQHEAGAQA
ncbi:MAG: SpoIIE family protein phosphatase [Succinivibrio sp.]|nr:SpoIIE family protein phosphatase [Succinivibrio sp.]